MAQEVKLFPSRELHRLLNTKYKPLTRQQSDRYAVQYRQTKDEKVAQKAAQHLINGVSKLFASEIYKNQRKFRVALGQDITFDELFNQMSYMVLNGIKQGKYDHTKLNLKSWTFWAIMPLTKNPIKVMGDKFASKNKGKILNIDKPFKGADDVTLGSVIPDESQYVDVQKDYTVKTKSDKLQKAISKLNKQQRQIIQTLFGYIPVKPEWQSKTGKVNAASIGRGMGIEGAKMRGIIEKILEKLRDQLKQSNFDKYFALDRLIQMYSGKRKFYKNRLLNKKQWNLL